MTPKYRNDEIPTGYPVGICVYNGLFLIQLGEGSFIRLVEKSVQTCSHKTDEDKDRPQQLVVTLGSDQQEADQVLGQGGEGGMHHRRDAAHPTSVGCRNTTGGVGIVAQHGDHFAQGEDEHTHEKHGGGGLDGEEGNTGNE